MPTRPAAVVEDRQGLLPQNRAEAEVLGRRLDALEVTKLPHGKIAARASGALFVSVGMACVSPFLFGCSMAFTSPTQSTMEGDAGPDGRPPPAYLVLTDETLEPIFASIINVGAVVGAFTGSVLCERLGRSRALAFTVIPHFVGWVGMALSTTAVMLLIFRTLIGWAVGIGSSVTPIFIGEVATVSLRGALGAANQLSIVIGLFVVNGLGKVFVVVDGANEWVEWRLISYFVASASLVLLGLLLMPESPRWLAQKGRTRECEAALRRLRRGEVEEEAAEIIRQTSSSSTDTQAQMPPLRHYTKSLVIAIGLAVLQQISGVNAVMMYAAKICVSAGVEDATRAAMGVMLLQVFLAGLSCVLMERVGRRGLLLFSCTCMAFAHFLLAYFFAKREQSAYAPTWLALAALGIYILGFSLGMGPIPWLILPEVFPTEVRGVAASLATAANWTGAFFVTLLFLPIKGILTVQGVFLLFAIICCFALLFVMVIVPETRGKTVEEVMMLLGEGPRSIRRPAAATKAH